VLVAVGMQPLRPVFFDKKLYDSRGVKIVSADGGHLVDAISSAHIIWESARLLSGHRSFLILYPMIFLVVSLGVFACQRAHAIF